MFNLNSFSLLAAEGNTTLREAGEHVIDTARTAPTTVVETFRETFDQIIKLAPNVLAMIVILVVGFVLAKVFARVATVLCEKIGLQRAAERSGLIDSMKQVGIARSFPSIVGAIVFWLLMCVALMAAFKVLGLAAVSVAMMGIVKFIPKILVAMVVVVIGLLVASFLRGVIATSADRVGISYAERLASGCYYIIALITFIAAADHLELEFALLNNMILIGFGALAVGFALAFGLGGRDVMGGILAGYYIRQRFSAGDQVSVSGIEGTVREVGPVSTTIESEESGLMRRRSVPNTVMLQEAIR